jgi:chemotaxis protein MotA
MNFSSLLGLIFGAGVMYAALSATTSDLRLFLDPHGILIVVGGTAAATSISFPIKDILNLVRVFLLRVLGRADTNYQEVISQFLDINRVAVGGGSLTEITSGLKNPFLREAMSLVATGMLSENEIKAALEQRLKTVESRYMQEANMFRTIGRFPPAFGLLATTLGMIALLQKIGQPDSQKLIGPAMSIGLIGTLYGIALANLLIIPIAENLTERTHEEMALRRMIIEGALLIKARVNSVVLRERLNSYLLPKHRVARKAAEEK